MEFYYRHCRPSTLNHRSEAAPTHQRMSACESSATSYNPSEGESWRAQARGRKPYTISCSFLFSIFHWTTFHKSIIKFNSPKALSCSLSALYPRMRTVKGLLWGTYLSWSIKCLYRCNQMKPLAVWAVYVHEISINYRLHCHLCKNTGWKRKGWQWKPDLDIFQCLEAAFIGCCDGVAGSCHQILSSARGPRRQPILLWCVSVWNSSGSLRVDIKTVFLTWFLVFYWPPHTTINVVSEGFLGKVGSEWWISDVAIERTEKKSSLVLEAQLRLVYLRCCQNRCQSLFSGGRGWWCFARGLGSSWVWLQTSNKEKPFWKSWCSESHSTEANFSCFAAEIIFRTLAGIWISQNLSVSHLIHFCIKRIKYTAGHFIGFNVAKLNLNENVKVNHLCVRLELSGLHLCNNAKSLAIICLLTVRSEAEVTVMYQCGRCDQVVCYTQWGGGGSGSVG